MQHTVDAPDCPATRPDVTTLARRMDAVGEPTVIERQLAAMLAYVRERHAAGEPATPIGEPRLVAMPTDEDVVIARSAVRRLTWLRAELERADVRQAPSLRAAYEREIVALEAARRRRLRALP